MLSQVSALAAFLQTYVPSALPFFLSACCKFTYGVVLHFTNDDEGHGSR